MNEKILKKSAKINSALTIRQRNNLIFKYENILSSCTEQNRKRITEEILAQEKRDMGFITYFLLSFIIRIFIENLIDSLLK